MKKLDVYLQEIKRQKISVDDLQHAAEILAATPQLPAELENPDLTREKREDLVRSLFPLAVRGIIEVLAQDQTMKMMPDLIKEAETFEKPDKYLRCVLEYVKEPDEKQAAGIRKFLSEKYPGRELRIVKEEKPELGSGFILRVGSEEYDWSTEGRKRALADKLKNLAKEPDSGDFLTQKGIIGILKGNLDGIDISVREIGTVSRVGDGIAYVDGIDHAMYGEIVALWRCERHGTGYPVEGDRLHPLWTCEHHRRRKPRDADRQDGRYPGWRGILRACCRCVGQSDRQ